MGKKLSYKFAHIVRTFRKATNIPIRTNNATKTINSVILFKSSSNLNVRRKHQNILSVIALLFFRCRNFHPSGSNNFIWRGSNRKTKKKRTQNTRNPCTNCSSLSGIGSIRSRRDIKKLLTATPECVLHVVRDVSSCDQVSRLMVSSLVLYATGIKQTHTAQV